MGVDGVWMGCGCVGRGGLVTCDVAPAAVTCKEGHKDHPGSVWVTCEARWRKGGDSAVWRDKLLVGQRTADSQLCMASGDSCARPAVTAVPGQRW
eukprot:349651-Chlamydomonas_euryale.AAC.9